MTIRNVPSVHSASDLYPLQRSLQASNPCALLVVKFSGTTLPKVTLSQFCWLQQTRSAGSGETLSQLSWNRFRTSPRRKRRHLRLSWPRKRLSTAKPPRMRGFLRRNSRFRLKPFRSFGNNFKMNRMNSGGLFFQDWHRPRKTTKQSLDVLRVMRTAVRGAGADGDKNAPRPAPLEQDTDMFKQKIKLLNESAMRARTESNVNHSPFLECVDGLLGEANALFLKNANTSDIINVDPCL